MHYETRTPDAEAERLCRRRWDSVAKPLHSLGKLEDLIVRIAGIQGTADVRLSPRGVLVFCADNGVVCEGVSQSDASVTAAVAESMARGHSNVNLMAACADAQVRAFDLGMKEHISCPGLADCRIAEGTADISAGPAMTREQAEAALDAGFRAALQAHEDGWQIAAVGEMGIGNTTTSAAVVCALLSEDPERFAGRGAGLSDKGLEHKKNVIRRALALNRPDPADGLGVLAAVGGFDLCAMAGTMLGGMQCGMPVILDGAIAMAAALAAVRICPAVREFLLPAHIGREPVSRRVCTELGFDPVVHADFALGEGTGALTLLPLLDMAYSVYSGTHTFDSLSMEAYTPQEGR